MGQDLDIPFTHGQSEAIDTKLLPNGLFSSLTNMRYRKDGRLVERYGIRLDTVQVPTATAGHGYGGIELPSGGSAHLFSPYQVGSTEASWVYQPEDGTKTANFVPAIASQLGKARRRTIAPEPTNTKSCDIGYINGAVVVAVCDTSTGGTNSHETRFSSDFSQAGPMASTSSGAGSTYDFGTASSSNVKVVVVSATQACYLYWDGTTNIRMRVVTAAGAAGFSASVTDTAIVAPFAAAGPLFDACAGPSGTIGLVYQSAALVLTMATLTVPGLVLTSRATVAVVNAARPCVAFDGTSTYQTTWIDGASFSTGNVSKQKWTTAGLSGGTTALDVSGLAAGFPVVGYVPNYLQFYSLWNTIPAAIAGGEALLNSDMIGNSFSVHSITPGMAVVSRPTDTVYGPIAIVVDGAKGGFGTYHVMSLLNGAIQGSVCADQAFPAASLYSVNTIDTRRSIAVVAAATANTPFPGVAYLACALPVVPFLGQVRTDVIRFETGLFGVPARCPIVTPSGAMFPGPRVSEFDGFSFFESSLGHGPEQLFITTAGGPIPAGTYQYTAVYEWIDSYGRRTLSPPTVPVSVVSGVGFTATVKVPNYANGSIRAASVNGANAVTNAVNILLYRTKLGETVFHFVSRTASYQGSTTLTSITDSALDATIDLNEVLYTQGVRGGLSGLTEYDPPPACAYLWCGNNRVIAGGLEDPGAIQWSKLFYPGEPVHWSALPQWRSQVNGEVTGVAALDGAWYVGTKDAIWVIGGDGPDDSGAGSFADPVKLPSDTGFTDQRSIVETQQGLMFQGKNGGIYLLPRGANAPTWVGQAVRDTLATYPFISSAVLVPKENCVYWACTNASGSAGVLIVYDTRISEWYVDSYYNRAITSLATHKGVLIIDGRHRQTPGLYTDDDTGAKTTPIVQTWITGDIRPFGPSGWGRIRTVTVLGEYRAPYYLLLEESVNAGQTWQTAQVWPHTSGTAGDKTEDQYQLPIVRTSSLRIRGTILAENGGAIPSETVALSSMTLEVFPSSGPARRPATNVG